MRVLALDPGPASSGFAILDSIEGDRTRCARVDHGEVDSDVAKLIGWASLWVVARCNGPRVDAIAIELPDGIHTRDVKAARSIGSATQKSARVGGYLAGFAQSLAIPLFEIERNAWARRLCGPGPRGGSASNGAVEAAVLRHVVGWPKRSNTHHRDAAGLGVIALYDARQRADRRTGT